MLANFCGGLSQRSEELFSLRKWFHDSSMAVPFYLGCHIRSTLAKAWRTMQNIPSLDKFDDIA
ncbi:uncharacterized protein Bfra_010845 [Botrytis fragariae]|uniref:Uncharacterized protein n=1 Tax=Botrytis fragariae TaxID=1964551 RepID=A0A8H6AL00_9HELO|nr:uncharacterized protein Bfra_010845 [Botrytis fragariae]KAF5869648.1 hypothetical protein Bfra_010845 [Botrytis fragariae]